MTLAGARVISAATGHDSALVLATTVRLDAPVVSARLSVSALGVFEMSINGAPVSDAVLSPGWTAYDARIRYLDHDVREALVAGDNELEILVGNGWYRGKLGSGGRGLDYGPRIGVIARLEVVHRDGAVVEVATDSTWRTTACEIVENTLFDGETIDLRRGRPARETAELDVDTDRFVAGRGPWIRRQQTIVPRESWVALSGETIVDFGENLVGWVRLRARGDAGQTVVVRHAEVLADGELCTRPLRGARATDTYVLAGDEVELEPTLTYHGFRYAGITGSAEVLDVEAVRVHSDLRRTGWFSCDAPAVDTLVDNVVRSLVGNCVGIPTDCPQRDERQGWTGDAAVFAPTACALFDMGSFLDEWLVDLELETDRRGGRLPCMAPNVWHGARFDPSSTNFRADTAQAIGLWSDAGVWVPWALWEAYGDRRRLREQFGLVTTTMRSIERMIGSDGVVGPGFQFGDWLDPIAPPQNPGAGRADARVVATACHFRSAELAERIARALGFDEAALGYAALAARIRNGFQDAFVSSGGRVLSDCETVYALAVHFGLLGGGERESAGRRLAELVTSRGDVIATGFAGTPYVCWALSETGHGEVAGRLIHQTRCPSWLYPVTMGATTIWERWDAMLPDGTVNPGTMTSFNHYALGSVADWLLRGVGGIRPAAPGYAEVRFAPVLDAGFRSCETRLDTPHGEVTCAWRAHDDGSFSAAVRLPDGVPGTFAPGHEVGSVEVNGDCELRWSAGGDAEVTRCRA